LLELTQNGQHYDYLYDGKGNVSALIDSNQQVVAAYRYDTFGNLISKSGTLDQPYQFSTKRYYAALGMVKYEYRDYLPILGKWMEKDPIGEKGGLNLYGFVRNNSINAVDPLGLILWKGSGGTIGAAAVIGGAFAIYRLTSQCVNGKKATITVIASGFAIGVGLKALPVGGSGGSAEFEDFDDGINPGNFNGDYGFATNNIIIGRGVTEGKVQLGKAVSTGWVSMEVTGLDVSLMGALGKCGVFSVKYSKCCDK